MTGRHQNVVSWFAKGLPSRRAISLSLCCITLASCTSLPGAGPRPGSFDQAQWAYKAPENEAEAKLPFALVDVDRKVVDTLSTAEDSTYFKGAFTDRTPPSNVALGPGDLVRITIFEAGPGGLFGTSNSMSASGNYVTLPDQEVDQTGHLSIPYAGKNNESGLVKAQGRSLLEVQHDIQQRLMNKAIEPQVIVTLVKRLSNLYSVIGDVAAPGRFSVDQGGIRVLDALTLSGGPKGSDYNTLITLQRGEKSASARLSTLLTEPQNNIFVQPGDLLVVKKEERYYNVLGATRNNNRVAFEAESVTVADAVAKAGGLDDNRAEPAALVVFRREDQKTLTAMNVPTTGFEGEERVPTVYRFDFNQPSHMFLAQKMQLRNDDVVFVSNHAFSDANKLLGVLRDVLLIRLIDD